MTSPTAQPALANHTSQNYNEHASFVYSDKNTAPILHLLNAQKGESIVDLGCGTGQLTEKIKALVDDGEVWGVDSSHDMVRYLSDKLKLIISFPLQGGMATPRASGTLKVTFKITPLWTLP